MSDDFEKWVSSTPRYCEPTWKDCEEAYLTGAASADEVNQLLNNHLAHAEQRVKELEAELARWQSAPLAVVIGDLEKQVDDLERELEGQKKANGFLVVERDRACEQHHEVARKLFEVERERDCALNRERQTRKTLNELLAGLKAQAGEPIKAVPVDVAEWAVQYVGSANYQEREDEAIQRIEDAMFDAYTTPSTPAAEQVMQDALVYGTGIVKDDKRIDPRDIYPTAEQAAWINQVIQDIAELPDRNSPDDWPEAMIVTGDELRRIIEHRAPVTKGEHK